VIDADVPAYWSGLGLPGLVDIHVHFMPERVLRKVWAYFDSAGPLTGRDWPIRYRWPEAQRLEHLRALGVRAFPSLLYPHKPGMAEWLNGWAAEFAAAHADIVPTATFFPEPGAAAYVESALRGGARVFKAHLQVGGYDPRDPLLEAVWGTLADAAVPVVVHAGHGPTPGRFTGPEPFGGVLARHPSLTAVIAHMGWPDYDTFLGIAERFDNVHVDTTMCFIDFFDDSREVGAQLAPRLDALREKVVLGTDFPNIPYDYAHQIEALDRLGLGEEWMRSVLWHNGARLLGVSAGAATGTEIA
jgi:predicted TIM-barrel fold metal-dependent hydrolase